MRNITKIFKCRFFKPISDASLTNRNEYLKYPSMQEWQLMPVVKCLQSSQTPPPSYPPCTSIDSLCGTRPSLPSTTSLVSPFYHQLGLLKILRKKHPLFNKGTMSRDFLTIFLLKTFDLGP